MNGPRDKTEQTVALHTLGCKLNQYETEAMRERFERAGYRAVPFDAVADVYVVNSCTVTASSDRDTRRLARRAKHRNPGATVVVAGCYAQTDADTLRAIEEIDLILGNREKRDIVAHVVAHAGTGVLTAVSDAAAECAFRDEWVGRFGRHTRAFVKIQDGCDFACSYCKVRFARGRSRSRPLESVVQQVARLAERGHAEIVLVGVHLAAYGRDLPEPVGLSQVVERLLRDVRGLERLRLSSLHPREVPDKLIRLVAETGRVCRHFHLPVQSGDDDILRAMRRPYQARDFIEKVGGIAARIPQVGIGADLMVGFPGERDDQFERTFAMVQALPLTYLHVFSFSPRPGTPAAEMSDQVPGPLKRRRTHAMRRLSQQKARAFQESLIGTVQEVLIEERQAPDSPGMSGLTDNYVRVVVEDDAPIGRVVPVLITGVFGNKLIGKPL